MSRRPASTLFLLVLAWSAPAAAFRTAADLPDFEGQDRVAWSSHRLLCAVSDDVPSGVTLTELTAATVRAGDAWRAECSDLELTVTAPTSQPARPDDGLNTLAWLTTSWRELGLSADVAATSDLTYERDTQGQWTIVEGDLLFNALDFAWSGAGDAIRDPQSVATHELGHLLGLRHPCTIGDDPGAPACSSEPTFASAVMYPLYRGTDGYVLGSDDAAGLCVLYPAPMCRSDGDCASGTVCEAGECVPECARAGCPAGYECGRVACEPIDCAACDPATESCPEVCSLQGGQLGQPCAEGRECRSQVCSPDGFCTETCAGSCAAGWTCTGADALCAPPAGVYGAVCETPSDCSSGFCLDRNDMATCTDACAEARDCPSGHRCALVEGRHVCAPPASSGGCRAAPSPAPSNAWIRAIVCATVLRQLARRRR